MELINTLQKVELFSGLTAEEVRAMALICQEKILNKGDALAFQGERGDELFIVTRGFVEIVLDENKETAPIVVVNLGEGQIIGEMSLVDQGPRSATLKAAVDQTCVQVIQRGDFESLCEHNTHIGYVVMRNIASDLSFKLRHRNLTEGSRR